MDVREKLVEICFHEFCMVAGDSPCGCDGCPYGKYGSDVCYEEYKKDKLENLEKTSVTVQEWIPADEPPKKYRDEYGELIPFLVCEEDTDYPFRAMYDGKTWGDGIFAIPVKWWMHLPAPPKEKERKDGDSNV